MHAAILSDQVSGITVFLPTNEAINATFDKFGLDMEGLLKNQHLCTEILQYHILPSPIEVRTASCPCRHCLCSMMHDAGPVMSACCWSSACAMADDHGHYHRRYGRPGRSLRCTIPKRGSTFV